MIQFWTGNNNVDQGGLTINEIRQDDFISFKLEFLKHFAATNTAEFTFNSENNQTIMTWSMYGKITS
jgi:hypothetical protein